MKVTIYGAGNQDLYVNKLNLMDNYGGKPPYGGSRMAMEFAEAGHEVCLAEPNETTLPEEQWDLVKKSGVSVVSDDVEAAKDAEIAVFFTPFGKKTFKIAKTILEHLPEGAVIANTCTVSPMVLYYSLEAKIRKNRPDIGICSMHPAAVPGTPQHSHYIVGGTPSNGDSIATPEQVERCEELAKSTGKSVYTIPADVSPAVADMGSLVTAVTVAGVLDYYAVGTKVINAPKEMVEKQILMTLQTLASLVESSGVDGMLRVINPDLLVKTASSMHLFKEQKELDAALEILSNLDPALWRDVSHATLKPTNLVAAQALSNEIQNLMGEKAAAGTIRRCMRKLFE